VKKSQSNRRRRQLTSSAAPIETSDEIRRRLLAAARGAPRKSRRRAQRARHDDNGDDYAIEALHPFQLYRTETLAKLLSVNRATIWRMRQRGELPPFVRVGSIYGLTGAQLAKILAQPDAVLAAVEEQG
jgi:predicted DNA-binding transcriptional regulator AlpA